MSNKRLEYRAIRDDLNALDIERGCVANIISLYPETKDKHEAFLAKWDREICKRIAEWEAKYDDNFWPVL